ncbi:hypothetical protein HY479_03335 [Candidatus Uhrbacteria bacterium]|nr:hypothetical protein [Candidatus Uhrbacteria bacterium]
MEMLIVVALFSVSVVVLAQTFASFNQLHRRIANRAVLSQDTRFIMESLVRTVRNLPLSYIVSPLARESELRLDQADGMVLVVKLSAPGQAECADLPTVSCLLLSTDGGTTWAPISGKRINIERFDVYARPSDSPFIPIGGVYPNDIQPFVTVSLRTQYMADNPKDRVTLEAQTTVSSRVYAR